MRRQQTDKIAKFLKDNKSLANPAPVDINRSIFTRSTQDGCTLRVPDESVDVYKKAPEWNRFDVVGFAASQTNKKDENH